MSGTYIAHLGFTYAHQMMSGKAEGLNPLNELLIDVGIIQVLK